MLLKEALSAFSLVAGLFTISGFAIKVDKFENNHILQDPKTEKTKMFLPIESFNKLNLKAGDNFKYYVGSDMRIKKITQIETHSNHTTLIFDEPFHEDNHLKVESVKYYLEAKPFWANLFK
ncbi:hypothetical protein [Candidatus Mycoplasma haematominutum]|uniref:Uncharacterized protein n=1 Tax=Candidatus Mycoplasma haematominutum 'Birmingham 1' TaxID=1116213 RepID=G8C3Z0_9MOLU|nr:hypothetical protein [Candidatus Mycoplasma haematominutum]CCE67038.1 hypothetical protein (homolog to MSU_0855) [Candidatus Mycoplasma haematominutum 'Birmingham 1']